MKKFHAKEVEVFDDFGNVIKTDDKGNIIDVSFKTFALTALRFPTSDIDAVKLCEITDVIRKIKPMQTGEEIELEDAEFQILKDAVLNMKFKMVSEDWADFVEYIRKQ